MIRVMNANTGSEYLYADATGWRDALVSTAMMEAKIGVSSPDQRPKFDAQVKLTRYGAMLRGWWVKRTSSQG